MSQTLLTVEDLTICFGAFTAVKRASLRVKKGEIIGIVGESGSGKTTLIRAIMGLQSIHSGQVLFEGEDITNASAKTRRRLWSRMQMIFQDPSSALSPRRTIGQSLAEPLEAHGRPAGNLADLMHTIGLPADMLGRRPGALSGGQKQRVAIARALALKPQLILADEPMSALDVSVKAQIAQLFLDLRAREGVSMIIVAHDLALMAQIADHLIVMNQGCIVEAGPARAITQSPQAAYTRSLKSAVLDPIAIARERLRAS